MTPALTINDFHVFVGGRLNVKDTALPSSRPINQISNVQKNHQSIFQPRGITACSLHVSSRPALVEFFKTCK
jgi:hypothetical protein